MDKNLIRINLNEKGIEELIPVYKTTKGSKVVNGRELWNGLSVKQDFSDWIKKQLENVEAIEDEGYSLLKGETSEQGGRPGTEYIITLDIAKEICMVAGIAPRSSQELKTKSKQYRKYLINVEKSFKEIIKILTEEQKLQLSIFNAKDKQGAILASAELDRFRQYQLVEKDNTIKELSPLAELARKRIDRTGTVSLTDITKTYNLKRGQMSTWGKEKGYIHKTLQEVNTAGEEYFKVVEANGFKTIAILEEGIKLIDDNIDEIKTYPTSYKKLKK